MTERAFFDPTIPRKSNIVDGNLSSTAEGPPLPSIVEISESGTCNRTCSFCPRSAPDFQDVKAFIDPALLQKLVDQLGAAGFDGMFLFSGFVEPLLDKNIYDLVSRVRKGLPSSRIEMVTNGDVLDRDRLLRLMDSGLSTLLISVYDGKEAAEQLEKLCLDSGLSDDQYVIRHRYLTEDEDFGITLSNRAGMMENSEFVRPALNEPLERPCYYPSYTFFMDYQGDVLLCPHDWGKKFIAGNMKEQSFMEIWTSPEMSMIRQRLNQADRGFKPCDVCDVLGTYIGRKHAEEWGKTQNYKLADVEE